MRLPLLVRVSPTLWILTSRRTTAGETERENSLENVQTKPAKWNINPFAEANLPLRQYWLWRSTRGSGLVRVWVVGAHGSSRAWPTRSGTNRAQRTLWGDANQLKPANTSQVKTQKRFLSYFDLVLDQLFGVVDLLRWASDGKQFEVGVAVGRRLAWDLHEGAGLLVDRLHVLTASANHKTAFVGGDWKGHLAARRAPVSWTTPPATPTRWHACARRTGRTLRDRIKINRCRTHEENMDRLVETSHKSEIYGRTANFGWLNQK